MRAQLIVLAGLGAVLLVFAVGMFLPRALGYASFGVMFRDLTDRDYSRPYDRADLRKDIVTAGYRLGDPAFVRIFKRERRVEVWMQARGEDRFGLFRSYDICAYSGELGPKLKEGDHQAPEGFYAVAQTQLNPNSRHHLSFNIGFPNAYDQSYGRTGTYLMVHGGCTSVGCYAVTDEKVDEIYAIVEAALKNGQTDVPVHAFPFEMTEVALAAESEHEWAPFWQNLAEGYERFEREGVPPPVGSCDGQYVFGDAVDGANCTQIMGWLPERGNVGPL